MRKRVLVVDDVPDWRDQLEDILTSDYEVKTVDNYDAAMQVIRRRETELVIVDLRLSPTDENDRQGLELLKQLAEYRINAIVLTGYPEQNIKQECEEKYNAFDFIDKSAVAGNIRVIRDVVREVFSLLESKEKNKARVIQETSYGGSPHLDKDILSSWPLRKFRKK